MRIGWVVPEDKVNYEPYKNPPLGGMYLLTILRREFGDSLDLSMVDLRGVSPAERIYHVPECDLYMYYVTTPHYPEVRDTVDVIRRAYPQSAHVAGGPHIDIFREAALQTFDHISLGEAEEHIKRMICDHLDGGMMPIYESKTLVDVNKYPFAERHWLPKTANVYTGMLSRKYPDARSAVVLFSRGCPFSCDFCSNIVKQRARFRSADNMRDEIEYLKETFGVDSLVLRDDNGVPVGKKQARTSFAVLRDSGLLWRGQSRANDVDMETIEWARESGCVEVAVGLESVCQRSLDLVNKKIDLDEAAVYFRNLKRAGIDRRLLLIVGLPGEPDDMVERTIAYIEEVEPSSVLLSILCLLPGTPMFLHPERYGMRPIREIPFDKYRTAFGRFDAGEHPSLTFEYEEVTPWGRGKRPWEIVENYERLQEYCRRQGLNF